MPYNVKDQEIPAVTEVETGCDDPGPEKVVA